MCKKFVQSFPLLVLLLQLRNFVGQVQGQCLPLLMSIDDKIVVITGGNSGIGKETAIDLARRGGKIYLACRDVIKCETARDEIRALSGSEKVHFLQLDLASFDSIREFSRKFHENESKLDILINNAGVMSNVKSHTMEGFESHFGVNHLGHFLLTNLLLDLLKAAAPSRIVVVSSDMHVLGDIVKDDLNSDRSFFWIYAYSNSKLANILFADELARRLEGSLVSVNSLHPGYVNTKLTNGFWPIVNFLLTPFKNFFLKTVKAGAQTSIHLAVDPQLTNVTGKYFSDCHESEPSALAKRRDLAIWLWKKSEDLTKFTARDVDDDENENEIKNELEI